LFFICNIHAQNNYQGDTLSGCDNREPVVAGQFYPDNINDLRQTIKKHFREAKEKVSDNGLRAIIVPHAGYVFSGTVAASSYKQINPGKEYDNIFILAPSHRTQFEGASIYSVGNYRTPLGEVKVNRKLANQLINAHDVFDYIPKAHQEEHSLEVQLPFLQYYLKNEFRIVPVVFGTRNVNTIQQIARVLKPYYDDNNLFVISTDFSHYPKYKDAVEVDQSTADAIVSNSPDQLIRALRKNSKSNYDNLLTSMCGWPGVLSLLYITEGKSNVEISKVMYRNSGDETGDKGRVVGYWSIAFFENQTEDRDMSFQLNSQEKTILLEIARETLEGFIREGDIPDISEDKLTETLKEPAGAFVTLQKDGELRGCIGRFNPDEPLYKIVQNMAIASSTQDVRFPDVTEEELDDIEIEISVLTPMEKVSSPDDIKLGVHGVYIKRGPHSGTFLPQVAQATGWSKEEFLGHCARDKAGLSWDAWKEEDTELYTYRAIIFHEKSKGE
jgi:AmmeMemoRadiSam system protein B/AmmeMemoRadiSam system protein A